MNKRWHGWFVVLALAAAGCNRSAAVHGTVTYEGKPLKRGFITFFPVDRHGVGVGAEVADGSYDVRELSPGKKQVLVSVPPRPAPLKPDAKPGQVPKAVVELRIAPTSPGNNRMVDIHPGSQSCDVDIKKP